MLRIATLFSGGFGSVEQSLRYLNIKHEVVFAAEWMKPQRESYLLNFGEPTDEFYTDVKEIDGKKYKGKIDYLHGSPPCQSYSLAGRRGGLSDERGGLMMENIRLIDEVQPKMFTVENVKGLLSSNNGEDWKNIIRDFKSLKGYTISWGVMNAKEQGTPQNRERVFIVGFRGQSTQFSFPQRQDLKVFLYHLLEDSVDDKYFLSEKMMNCFIVHKDRHDSKGNGFWIKPKSRDSKIANTISTKAGTRATDNFIQDLVQVGTVGNEAAHKNNSSFARVYDINGIAPTQMAKGGGGGAKTGLFMVKSNTKSGYETAKLHYGISLSRPTSTTRRGRVGKQVAQTLDTSSSQCVLVENVQNFKIRKLTPRECARVQGDFKDMFKFGKSSDTKLYEFIGNAMDINTTKNLITKMLDHLKNVKINEPSEPSFSRKEIQTSNLFELETA